jgi:hypothetical protein
LLSVKHNHSK